MSSKNKSLKIDVVEQTIETIHLGKEEVLIFKANKPLTPCEFNTVADLLRREQQETGIKIILKPFSVDLEG
jgi:hypothetical protein